MVIFKSSIKKYVVRKLTGTKVLSKRDMKKIQWMASLVEDPEEYTFAISDLTKYLCSIQDAYLGRKLKESIIDFFVIDERVYIITTDTSTWKDVSIIARDLKRDIYVKLDRYNVKQDIESFIILNSTWRTTN